MNQENRLREEVPVVVADRAAGMLRKRCEELGGATSVRIDINETKSNTFNCELCFALDSDLGSYQLFLSNEVPLAVKLDDIPVVNGMKLVYFDGSLNVTQGDCSRKPSIKNIARTISVHSVLDEKTNPGGQNYYTPGETQEERNRSNQVQTTLLRIGRFLDSENGLFCVPRFFRRMCLETIHNESASFLDRYCTNHLQFVVDYIEPLAKEPTEGGNPEFQVTCRALSDAPDMEAVADVLKLDRPAEFDPMLWLGWAVSQFDIPANCLYCAANFLVVPPLVETLPKSIEGVVRALVAASLTKLSRPESAVEVIESFLLLTPNDYQSIEMIHAAIQRSPLAQLELMPRTKMIEVLAEGHRLTNNPDRANVIVEACNQLFS